jgi:hypothetical protein
MKAILTSSQAALLCDAHEIDALLESEEEIKYLQATNPGLLEAYRALNRMAIGADATGAIKAIPAG